MHRAPPCDGTGAEMSVERPREPDRRATCDSQVPVLARGAIPTEDSRDRCRASRSQPLPASPRRLLDPAEFCVASPQPPESTRGNVPGMSNSPRNTLYRYLRIDQQTTAVMIPTLAQGTPTDHDGEIPPIGPLPNAIPAMAPAPSTASPVTTHTCFPVRLPPSPLVGCSADFLSPDWSNLSMACRLSSTRHVPYDLCPATASAP